MKLRGGTDAEVDIGVDPDTAATFKYERGRRPARGGG